MCNNVPCSFIAHFIIKKTYITNTVSAGVVSIRLSVPVGWKPHDAISFKVLNFSVSFANGTALVLWGQPLWLWTWEHRTGSFTTDYMTFSALTLNARINYRSIEWIRNNVAVFYMFTKYLTFSTRRTTLIRFFQRIITRSVTIGVIFSDYSRIADKCFAQIIFVTEFFTAFVILSVI